ncbi:hypothetical protein SETIT_9G243500v2 [Setaria italica]|uniref:SHSP domain-containing protein n=1 Tax=Setaria italica TaxID=4555 RepID=K4AED6_SETIT|nr:inactive protein RESTRICTED TEV MOVEMENT 2 [Setaria italica]RCV42780.1 hypothetical protein SETIT_9G243500v2 [Setaria italica]
MDSNGRVFEDFVPPHSMVSEPATHTLSIDLSAAGYNKEQVRVQMVRNHRRLIVRGERPVAGNRWSRFRLELRVPDDCDVKAIHAKFVDGVVLVTMPGVAPEPVRVEAGAAAGQQDPSPPAAVKPAAAASAQDQKDAAGRAAQHQQDGDGRAARGGGADDEGEKKEEAVQKQEMRQRVTSSAKDDGGRDDAASGEGEVLTPASPSRQDYGFLHGRRKMATTVLGVVLVLISLGIYVKYSLWP